MPQVVRTVSELRAALAPLRQAGVAMVPTMGALHEGHLSLVRAAAARGGQVVVSIFVNPAQFAPHEDFASYPRDLVGDLAKLDSVAETIVFAPAAQDMYAEGFATTVAVGGPSVGLESEFRPHFFAGVATVVTKLLIAALPNSALFGEKDYQQFLVIRQLARDLGIPTEIVGSPIIREPDGLALSSRNAYLSYAERQVAGALNDILKQTIVLARREGDIAHAQDAGKTMLLTAGFDSVDYVAIRDAATLDTIAELERPARILAAARIGRTRLIDNMRV